MKSFIVLSSLLCICSAFSLQETKKTVKTDGCCPLSGTWINQHGSFMELNHAPDGTLTGRFYTAVEETKGASGGAQLIHGKAGKGKPTTFGMVATFKDGSSTTAWSGQYHFCDGEQTLTTTWVMTSLSKSCGEDWKNNRVGQDRFVRKSNRKTGPKWASYARKLFNKFFRNQKKTMKG
eukprot:gene19136-21053_t